MADYSENEINRMRSDALRRMREMQRRAMGEQTAAAPEPSPQGESLGSLLGKILSPRRGNERGGGVFNIGGIAIDEEKAMIAMLIYILYKQGADVKLLLALGYLLL